MRVYVETNFVLELVLGQEQAQACHEILALAESGLIDLVVPAFSILEPYQRLMRRKRDRDELQSGASVHPTNMPLHLFV